MCIRDRNSSGSGNGCAGSRRHRLPARRIGTAPPRTQALRPRRKSAASTSRAAHRTRTHHLHTAHRPPEARRRGAAQEVGGADFPRRPTDSTPRGNLSARRSGGSGTQRAGDGCAGSRPHRLSTPPNGTAPHAPSPHHGRDGGQADAQEVGEADFPRHRTNTTPQGRPFCTARGPEHAAAAQEVGSVDLPCGESAPHPRRPGLSARAGSRRADFPLHRTSTTPRGNLSARLKAPRTQRAGRRLRGKSAGPTSRAARAGRNRTACGQGRASGSRLRWCRRLRATPPGHRGVRGGGRGWCRGCWSGRCRGGRGACGRVARRR